MLGNPIPVTYATRKWPQIPVAVLLTTRWHVTGGSTETCFLYGESTCYDTRSLFLRQRSLQEEKGGCETFSEH